MNTLLSRYLDAVGIDGHLAPTPALLARLLESHVATFPYETLGLALGQPYPLEPDACIERCLAGRAGYCYTQNLAFTTVLERLGFDVRRHLGNVTGSSKPDPEEITGGHMAVTVLLDGVEWFADAGLGPGPVRPTRLVEGDFTVGPFTHRLEPSPVPGATWRLVLDPEVRGFRVMDFTHDPRPWTDFVELHETRRFIGEPNRPYFQVQRPLLERVEMLVGIRHSFSPGPVEALEELGPWRAAVEAMGCRALDGAADEAVAALHARLVREHHAFFGG